MRVHGVWMTLMLLAASAAHAETPVTVCAEPGSGPPWLYWKTAEQASLPKTLAGFSIDMYQGAFSQIGKPMKFIGQYPWSRCLKMVAAGEIDLAAGAYYDAERAKIYAFSKPYKVLTPQVFLLRSSPLQINSVHDLSRYRGCGMHGSSYAHYGLHEGELDQGSYTFESLIGKLKAGHCDYFVEELEVIAQLNGGRDHLLDDNALRHNDVIGAVAPGRHIIAAKGSSAADLLPQLDAAIMNMKKTGEFERLWKKNADGMAW
jgi:polar amino acid transport system substrate-binding protein